MCTIAAKWSSSIYAYLTVSLTVISRAAGVKWFRVVFLHTGKMPRRQVMWSRWKRALFLVLFCHPVATGEKRETSPKRLWLERLISPHPASKYHDCILGDSLPSASKAKNKSLSTRSSSHPSAFSSLYVFVSGLTADTSLMTKTIKFLLGAK